ncbi:3-oxoacyl-(acyl-carrier-protein) synthase-3 [Frankia sp. AiPs1]|uniref:ketoacyl-ACP synthase III family protein n=1 Tax=Frankia sp. AiPa1 TaxID=573492 RepID=UPI00202AE83F|nr:ketoacyl-ACP synthase III family protein [Frankia sp. AiPa1]MCL9760509.1 ketoacyl-ACP synthase III family protein [Frankia sp. AiPa1]
MRTHDLYLAAVSSELPTRLDVGTALAAGLCDAHTAEQTGIHAVSTSTAPPTALAAAAAARALRRCGVAGHQIRLLLHADVYYQGHDLWAAASHVQESVAGCRCPAVEIRQLSNGGMAALELASLVLRGESRPAEVLVTTGDTFHPPGFDRWRSDPGTVYGDGGTAAVLSNTAGFAAVRSIATVSDPALERMHRGRDPFGPAPFSVRAPMDLDVLKRDFLAEAGIGGTVGKVAAGQQDALMLALKDADADLSDIDWFILPHFGRRRLTAGYLRPWGVDVAATTWPWARTVGHLGAGDQYAGLEHLVLSGQVRPGQRCLLAGVGAGFTWSCAVLDVLDRPDWSTATSSRRPPGDLDPPVSS